MFEGMGNDVTLCAHLCLQKWLLQGAAAATEQPYKGVQGRVQDPCLPFLSFDPRNIEQIV